MAARMAPVIGALLAVPAVILVSHLLAGSTESVVQLDLGQVNAVADLLKSISDGLTTIAMSLVIASAIIFRVTDSKPVSPSTVLLAALSAALAVACIFFGYRMKVDLASLLLLDKQDGVPMEVLRHVLRLLRMQGMALVLSASFLVATGVNLLMERPKRGSG